MNVIYIDLQTNSKNPKTASVIAFSIAVFDEHSEVAYIGRLVKPNSVLNPRENARSGYTNEDLRNKKPFVEHVPEILEILQNGKVQFFDNFSERVWRKSFCEIGISLNKCSNILQRKITTHNRNYKDKEFCETVRILLPNLILIQNGFNARILAELHTILNEKSNGDEYAFAKAQTPNNFSRDLYTELPNTHGVYYFRDDEGAVIYVGKAINIKKRVRSHFKSTLPFERKLTNNTFSMDYYETGNELIALLKESEEISNLSPKYNTQQISKINPWVIESRIDSKGIKRLNAKEKVYSDTNHTISFNRDSVLQQLKILQFLFNLCPRFLGLERTSGSCSYSKCRGICRNEEPKVEYNTRAHKAFSSLNEFKETYYLKLKGRNTSEMSFVLVKDGLYLGYGFVPKADTISSVMDLEAYLISQRSTYFTSRSISQFLKLKNIVKRF